MSMPSRDNPQEFFDRLDPNQQSHLLTLCESASNFPTQFQRNCVGTPPSATTHILDGAGGGCDRRHTVNLKRLWADLRTANTEAYIGECSGTRPSETKEAPRLNSLAACRLEAIIECFPRTQPVFSTGWFQYRLFTDPQGS